MSCSVVLRKLELSEENLRISLEKIKNRDLWRCLIIKSGEFSECDDVVLICFNNGQWFLKQALISFQEGSDFKVLGEREQRYFKDINDVILNLKIMKGLYFRLVSLDGKRIKDLN